MKTGTSFTRRGEVLIRDEYEAIASIAKQIDQPAIVGIESLKHLFQGNGVCE